MSSAAKRTFITPEGYLARERLATYKSEYRDGQIYAMSGASREHNLIAVNLVRVLGNQLLEKPCELYANDMRVRVGQDASYNYPDIAIVCGGPRFLERDVDTLLNPTALIEILSPSTEGFDRGGKFVGYRQLESLREYVLVSQDRILVERFSLRAGEWVLAEWGDPEGILRLESIDCSASLREIYAKVPGPDGGLILPA